MKWRTVGLLGVLLLLFLPRIARGQSVSECADLISRVGEALQSRHTQRIIDISRDFLGKCSDVVYASGNRIMDARLETSMLLNIGSGLVDQKHDEDAIPILRRCVAIKPDYAPCWWILGEASEALGRRSDAKAYWKKTIEIGGFDEMNANAVRVAKKELEVLEFEEKRDNDLPPDPSAPESNHSAPDEPGKTAMNHSFGTGFFVNKEGYILTNNHVVARCKNLSTRDGKPLRLLSRNTGSDLALLKADSALGSAAVFRSGPAPKLGDAVVAFGFPLPGILSSEGNVSTGVLSATSGLQNDIRFVQISAPVQPGNSGGPLFDSSGHVIGVVVAKLDALRVARATGDVPQNVNFAVHWSEVRAFLDEEGIMYRREPSQRDTSTRNIAATATQIAVTIDCTQ